jgi:hypothetical protein
LGVLKSQVQVETYYPLSGTLSLDFGQTYYWRIDEVNDLSDPPISKGDLWSFTVEPYAFPISGQNITATVSSQSENQGPEKTIDGSGLDINDFHSTALADMWVSQAGDPNSAWIQYQFDKVYKLYEMLVWNYNGQSLLSAAGLKDVILEYSTDGTTWTQIDNISEFAQASGADDYAYNTTVAFNGTLVKYVRINANSNWSNGFINQYGLSEVRFLYIPVRARMPQPNDGATDVAIDVTLGWRPGREAAEHVVNISTEEQAVRDGIIHDVTVLQESYGPLFLNLGKTYYWLIDEVNNLKTPSVWQGDTWSFTTSEYLVVEDFESYNDIPAEEEDSNLVYMTWKDGYNNPSANGSIIGYFEEGQPSMETIIVHGGYQSVPVTYDNTSASLSEVTANTNDLAIGSDWTKGAPAKLSLWFYGDPGNPATDRLYVKVNSVKVIYDGSLAQAQWQEFSIDLTSLDINLSNVTTVSIGIDGAGAKGMLLLDDIRLYAPAP